MLRKKEELFEVYRWLFAVALPDYSRALSSAQVWVKSVEKRSIGRTVGSYSFYLRFIAQDKPALIGLFIVIVFLGWALIEGLFQLAGLATGHRAYGFLLLGTNPLLSHFPQSLLPPNLSSVEQLLGMDFNGQSIFLRILYAAPSDALAAVLVVTVGLLVGMLIGASAAYFGGWVEEVFMRLTDAFLALPALVLAIAVGILLGAGFTSVLIALMFVWWPTYARFFRGQALALKSRGFVDSARLSGLGSLRILFRHIIPNSVDPVVAYATLDFGNVILTYSALSFLGIGVQPPFPEWGAMSFEGLSYFPLNWWWSLFPGLVILLVVVGFTLIGDRLQDLISGRMMY
jgi:peptide/nickel transport system permease protein